MAISVHYAISGVNRTGKRLKTDIAIYQCTWFLHTISNSSTRTNVVTESTLFARIYTKIALQNINAKHYKCLVQIFDMLKRKYTILKQHFSEPVSLVAWGKHCLRRKLMYYR